MVLAWSLRDEEPELHRRFEGRRLMTADLLFLVYHAYGALPREVTTTAVFSPDKSKEEF